MDKYKKLFAAKLKKLLQGHYGEKLPSYNVIARDFALQAANVAPVSSETVRHWLLGESLPHLSRMQVLISWLGPDLDLGCVNDPVPLVLSKKGQEDQSCPEDQTKLCDLIEKLSHHEREALMGLVQMILAKHDLAGGGIEPAK